MRKGRKEEVRKPCRHHEGGKRGDAAAAAAVAVAAAAAAAAADSRLIADINRSCI